MKRGKRKGQCTNAKQRNAPSLANKLNGNIGRMMKDQVSHSAREEGGNRNSGKEISIDFRRFFLFGGGDKTRDGILYAGGTHRMYEHHDRPNQTKYAKAFFMECS